MKFCTWDPRSHPHTFERVLVSVRLVWARATYEEEGGVSVQAPGPGLPDVDDIFPWWLTIRFRAQPKPSFDWTYLFQFFLWELPPALICRVRQLTDPEPNEQFTWLWRPFSRVFSTHKYCEERCNRNYFFQGPFLRLLWNQPLCYPVSGKIRDGPFCVGCSCTVNTILM